MKLRSFIHTLRGWWKHDPRSVPRGTIRGIWNIITFPFREKASVLVRNLRRVDCRKCPVFDNIHGTCGDMVDGTTYEHPITGKQLPLGCGCDYEMKTALASSDCWLYEKRMEGGWRTNLNGSEH